MSTFKDSIKKELEKNKELQATLKGIREDETLKKAGDAARAAAAGVQKAAHTAGSSASAAAEQASARASRAASHAAQMTEEAKAKAGYTSGGSDAKASAEAPPSEEPAASGPGFFERIRGLFGGGAATPPPQGEGDATTYAVVVKQPSFWEKTFNFASESPFGRFGSSFGDAAGGIGDRFFGETEQAEALRELREMMPDFDMDAFLATEVVQKQKDVLGAYLRGDMEELKRTCSGAAYGALHKSIMERQAHSLQVR